MASHGYYGIISSRLIAVKSLNRPNRIVSTGRSRHLTGPESTHATQTPQSHVETLSWQSLLQWVEKVLPTCGIRGVHDSYPSSCRAPVALAYAGVKLTSLCLGFWHIKSRAPLSYASCTQLVPSLYKILISLQYILTTRWVLL
jgi:hypothetical protein